MIIQKLLKPSTLQRNKPQSKKHRLFRLFHQILIHYSINNKLCFIFFVIELCQFVYYTIHPMYQGLWNSQIIKIIQLIFSFTTLEGIWNLANNFMEPLIFVIINNYFLDIVIAIFVMILILYEVFKKPVFKDVNIIAVKIIMYYGVILRTFLFLPMIYASSICIFSQNKAIQSSILPITASIGILNILMNLILAILYSNFMIENSPFVNNPFAGPINHIQIVKYFIKIFIGFYSAVMFQPNSINILVQVVLIISFGYILIKSYLTTRYFNPPFKYLFEILPVSIFWMAFVSILQQLTSRQENIGMVFILMGCIVCNLAWQWLRLNREKNLIKSNYRNISKADETIEYNYLSTLCVNNYEDPQSIIFLQGMLSYHTYNCRKGSGNCVCQSVKQRMINTNFQPDRIEIKQQKKFWFKFIKHNLVQVKGKYKNNAQITLLLSLIEKDQLSNRFKALHCLQQPSHFQNGLKYQFLNYHIKRKMEQKMFQDDRIQNQKKSVDINKFQQFQNKYFHMERMIQKSVNDHLQFWSIIKSQAVTKDRILFAGKKIFKGIQKITNKFMEICNINGNNLYCLILYSNFMKLIANCPQVYQKNAQAIKAVKRNICTIGKFSNQSQKQKYSQNAITGIIVISAQRKNIGIIKHCSSKVTQLLGYTNYELVSQNINTLMPKFIGNMHDDVLRNYLELSQSQYDFIQRVAPIIDKNNFMSLCRILTKPLPNLLNGVQLIGIFCPIFQTHYAFPNQIPKYILYRSDSLQVQALSESCFNQYGYRLTKLNQMQQTCQDLNIGNLFDNFTMIQKATSDKGINSNIIIKDYNGTVNQISVTIYLRHQLFYFGVKIKLIYFFSSKKYNQFLNTQGSAYRNLGKIMNQGTQIDCTGLNKIQSNQVIQDSKKNQSKLIQEKIKIDYEPVTVKIIDKFGLVYMIIIIIISSLYLFLDINSHTLMQNCKITLGLASMSISKMMDINYYSRIMHLSNHYPTQLPFYSEYRQIHKKITSSLQTNQFNLVKMELIAAQNGYVSQSNSSNFSNFIIGPNGKIQKTFANLDSTVFDYITSSSNYNSAAQSSLDFSLQMANNIPSPVTQPFANLFRLRYTGLFSAIQGKQKLLESLHTHYQTQISKQKDTITIRFLAIIGIILAVICFGIPIIISIIQTTDDVLMIFCYFTINDIDFQIHNCQVFLDIFYEDSYQVILRKKTQEVLKKKMNRTASFDVDQIKLSSKLKKGSAVLKYATMHSEFQIKNDRAQTLEMASARKLQLMQKKFDQLSSQQIIQSASLKIQNHNNHSFNSHNHSAKQQQLLQQQKKKKKLSNQKSINKYKLSIIFILFNLFVVIYFISIYILSQNKTDKSIANLNNYKLLLKNQYLVKAIRLYNLQTVVDNSVFMNYSTVQSVYQNYTNVFYQKQRNLYQVVYDNNIQDFSVLSKIYQSNQNSVCNMINQIVSVVSVQNLYNSLDFNLNECQNLEKGILAEGLRTSCVAYSQLLTKIKNYTTTQASIQSIDFQTALKMQKYIDGTFLYFIQSLSDQITSQNQNKINILIIVFCVSVIMNIFIFAVLWRIYSKVIKNRLVASLQMLKIIPSRVFLKNSNLDKQYSNITKLMIQ